MAGHSHSHAHGAAAPADGTGGIGDRRRLLAAAVVTGLFMLAEVAGGLISGSLALLSDAAHMLTDAVALAGALLAFWLGDRPADRQRTFGYGRLPVLAAFTNGVVLIVIVVWIVAEALQRLLAPSDVMPGTMAAIAAAGLVVNIVVFWLLHGGARAGNLNMRGAAVHVLGDLLGSVAALAGAGVIYLTGWTPIDPLLSLLVAAIVARSAWFVVRRSAHVLLEGTPQGVDPDAVAEAITTGEPEVADVHNVHCWSIAPERALVSLHAGAHPSADADALARRIKALLAEQFGVSEAVVQVEFGRTCPDTEAGTG